MLQEGSRAGFTGKKANVSRNSVGQRGRDLASKGVKQGFSEEVIIGDYFWGQ